MEQFIRHKLYRVCATAVIIPVNCPYQVRHPVAIPAAPNVIIITNEPERILMNNTCCGVRNFLNCLQV